MKKTIITSMEKISPIHHKHNQYEFYKHEIERNQTISAFYTLPPGKSNYPFHYHANNEEVFYIISGNGIIETFDGKYPITAGDVAVCPAGKDGAHKIINASETDNLIYLDVDTYNTPDINYYPNSKKVGIRDFKADIYDNYNIDSKVDYYENE